MAGKSNAEMEEFWSSLPPKIKSLLWLENRRLILSSDEASLVMTNPSRYKATPKYYLFEDVFAVLQGNSVTEYHLDGLWLKHIVPSETTINASLTSFRVLYPEGALDLQCKELGHKSKWVTCIADAIGIVLGLQQFISGRGDLNLDTKLELLRSREYMEYTFHTHPVHRDGKYRGQWRDAMPHGSGEFSQESTGVLYKGKFSKGLFHGSGEMLWFSEKDRRKKYIGDFRNGHMHGHGEMKYSDGHIYVGQWGRGERWGFGRMEETSRRNSLYTGGWEADRKSGYGVYEDKMRHERYLGMWSDGVKSGPGMFVTSTGSYGEAIFSAGNIAAGNEGFLIDPNGQSFTGKLGPDLKLCGKVQLCKLLQSLFLKGKLVLTNGVTIEGSFGGKWLKRIEIHKGVLEDPTLQQESELLGCNTKELQIAKLDRRIGTCTVLASNKWQPIFTECESSLGFTGDATNDSYAAWSRLASNSAKRSKRFTREAQRRSNSLDSNARRTVRVPVELIPLERARTMTTFEGDAVQTRLDMSVARSTVALSKHLSLSNSVLHENPSPPPSLSLHHHNMSSSLELLDISRPLHLEKSLSCSPQCVQHHLAVPPPRNVSPYAPQADASSCSSTSSEKERPHSAPEDEVSMQVEEVRKSTNVKQEIQKYLDQAFSTEKHPLGTLMQRLEIVYKASYGGIGANKYLLPHAIAETHSLIQRIHGIVRILFPMLSGGDQNVSRSGFTKVEGFSDPDDYVDIESGYDLLHPLVFTRLFPTLITLYVLHHEDTDTCYQRGLEFLQSMDEERVASFIRFPEHLCKRVTGVDAGRDILKAVEGASSSLRVISSLFTPGEFLTSFRNAFTQLSTIEQLTGDFLLPAIVLVLVKANVPHLGAYLHFLTDFAHTEPADEYTLVTYEAAYNFIRQNAPGSF